MRAITITQRAAILLTFALFAFASCNTIDEDLNNITSQVVERTDMIIEGDISYEEFRQSPQGDPSADLITYNFYGNPSENFDFVMHLANGNKLIIRVYDAERMNPWEQVDQPYNIYPQTELEDKLSYTHVELRTAANEPIYATNLNNTAPPATYLDVFKVTQFDGKTIQCRMRDMILYSGNNPENTITVNGTFIGAVTF